MASNCLAIMLVVASSVNAFAQGHTTTGSAKTCAFSEIYRKDGWKIPGMPASPEAKNWRRPLGESTPGVYATKLMPNVTETTITRIQCTDDDTGRLQIDEEPIGIIWLWAYDFEGRTFAYGVRYVEEWIKDGARRQLGAESQAIFFDLDGSGRFTLMKGPGGPFVPYFIPDWVRKDNTK